ELYLPIDQIPDRFAQLMSKGMAMVLRTKNAPQSLSGPVRAATTQFDRDAVVYEFVTMEQVVSESIAAQRFAMTLLGIFAGLALVLAAIGIYGVISYFVSQRTQEVGIRMALGAQRGDVLKLILGQGTRMAFIGVGIGLAVSIALTRLMATMLYGVSATDPLTFAAVALLLVLVATFA